MAPKCRFQSLQQGLVDSVVTGLPLHGPQLGVLPGTCAALGVRAADPSHPMLSTCSSSVVAQALGFWPQRRGIRVPRERGAR